MNNIVQLAVLNLVKIVVQVFILLVVHYCAFMTNMYELCFELEDVLSCANC